MSLEPRAPPYALIESILKARPFRINRVPFVVFTSTPQALPRCNNDAHQIPADKVVEAPQSVSFSVSRGLAWTDERGEKLIRNWFSAESVDILSSLLLQYKLYLVAFPSIRSLELFCQIFCSLQGGRICEPCKGMGEIFVHHSMHDASAGLALFSTLHHLCPKKCLRLVQVSTSSIHLRQEVPGRW